MKIRKIIIVGKVKQPAYHAYLENDRTVCGKGRSSSEAIGDCILRHPKVFGKMEVTSVEYSGRFRVYLNSNRRIYGEGSSKKEALGTCVRYNFKFFHIIVD
jgi:hypothetical protein